MLNLADYGGVHYINIICTLVVGTNCVQRVFYTLANVFRMKPICLLESANTFARQKPPYTHTLANRTIHGGGKMVDTNNTHTHTHAYARTHLCIHKHSPPLLQFTRTHTHTHKRTSRANFRLSSQRMKRQRRRRRNGNYDMDS